MRVGIDYGREHLELDVAESNLLSVHRQPPPVSLADPAAAVRQALEQPLGFPALRRAVTPDDHVAIVVDEHLPHLATLLTPILEHLTSAHVSPTAVTLVCPPSSTSQPWVEELPDEFADVHVEVHDPSDRRRLSYLATTRQGRRLYLNRTAVDADQLILLNGRGYDPLLGYGGAEGALYPALSDEETRKEMCGRLSLAVPGKTPWPVRQEAAEAAWLVGAPFFVQVIEAAGDGLAHVLAGLADTSGDGTRLQDNCWRVSVDRLADTVVSGVSGEPARQGFADLARAAACAARVVKPQGHIVILSQCAPELGPGAQMLRQTDDPAQALKQLRQHTSADLAAAWQWAHAAQQASILLLSGLAGETVEELFAAPLDNAGQVQRLLNPGGSVMVLPDAHKTLALTADSEEV